MTRKRENLQAYFAGVFDSEGTVGIYKQQLRGDSFTMQVTAKIHMHNGFNTLALIAKEYPEARLSCPKQGGYLLVFHHFNAERFLKEILPYTIIKHEQIKVTLSFLEYKRQFGRSRSRNADGTFTKAFKKHWDRCEWFEKTVKQLKQDGYSGVNSVNALATHGLREYRAKPEDVASDVVFAREALERVETRLSENNKTRSAPEKDIVQS